MLLNNLVIADTGQHVNIHINDGIIEEISASGFNKTGISFTDAIVFPGLINSHDHLDFNLFPQLGSYIYKNYSEWGALIHDKYKTEIAAVLKIPQPLRAQWGMYKNLLCGVTTVLNHGIDVGISKKLINIYEEKHDVHSVGFDKKWWRRLNNPFKKSLPVVIHAGEGTDQAAHEEIDSLISCNLLNRDLIAIHGVAMLPAQARHFKALVWCPESNYYLLNKTAPVNQLKLDTKILFGTDSTLTGYWSIWDHIQFARETALLSDEELYQTLNVNGADVWGMNTGELAAGKDADLVVAKMKDANSFESFFALNPADMLLVMHKGNIRLIDHSLYPQVKKNLKHNNYTLLKIGDSYKYVEGNLSSLINTIKQYWPQADFPVEVVSEVNYQPV